MNELKRRKQTGYLRGGRLVMLLVIFGAAIITGCSGPSGPAERDDDTSSTSDFQITGVKYMIMNLAGTDSSDALRRYICDDANQDVTNCFWFQISYSGELEDMDTLIGTLKTTFSFDDTPEFNWSFEDFVDGTEDLDLDIADFDKRIVDTDNRRILVRGLHSLDTAATSGYQNALPLGDLTVTLEFDGDSDQEEDIISIMGPEEIEAAKYIYTTEQSSTETETMIQPAQVNTATSRTNIGGVVLNFTVPDERVTAAQIWFFDQYDRLIAYSPKQSITEEEVRLDIDIEDIQWLEDDDDLGVDDLIKYSVLLTESAESDGNIFIASDGCVSFTPIYSF